MGQQIVGIEIGGTKLQLAVADADHPEQLLREVRYAIDRSRGAQGILAQIVQGMAELRTTHEPTAVGIGFGGPVLVGEGRVITSHQVTGWDNFAFADWTQHHLQLPSCIGNDCNVAALAEAKLGAGQGLRRVLYVTVGTGIGGGMIVDGHIDGEERPAITEIGHLRPGLSSIDPHATVESIASGLGIAQQAQHYLQTAAGHHDTSDHERRLLAACHDKIEQLTTHHIAQEAALGNPLAQHFLDQATQTLGWALAQATTLLAPERIVIGGGVTLIGERFLVAIDNWRRRYDFPPLLNHCDLVPAQLGERVVLYGAILLARQKFAR